MYKPGKCSERSRLESREEAAARDECKDHIVAGVSHRETINDKVLAAREMARLNVLLGVKP